MPRSTEGPSPTRTDASGAAHVALSASTDDTIELTLATSEKGAEQLRPHDVDADDPIEGAYDLEVSSPGMNRVLRHEADFRRFAGMTAKIVLEPKETLTGVIAAITGDGVTLQMGTSKKPIERTVAWTAVVKASLAPTPDEWDALGRKLAAENAAREAASADGAAATDSAS